MRYKALKYYRLPLESQLTLLAILIILVAAACSRNENKNKQQPSTPEAKERFHADNDIAMTVRSLVDAIRVGEPLDSTEYDFQGVLTDGQGSPLYTDVQGAPGEWLIDVLDDGNVTIKNLYLGDLLPDDLQNYILSSLRMAEENKMNYPAPEAVNDDETEISVYGFNGGFLRFEVRAGVAPNGLEGPYMTIILSATPPAGAEIQKAA